MWLFLLAARHRMQALSALACSVGFGFGVFASLKIALFIQTSTREADPFYFWVSLIISFFKRFLLEETIQFVLYRVNLLQAHLEQLSYDVCIVVHTAV